MRTVIRLTGKADAVFKELKRMCISDRPIDMEPTRIMWINPGKTVLQEADEILRNKGE